VRTVSSAPRDEAGSLVRMRLERLDPRLRQHPPVAHQHHPRQTESAPPFLPLVRDRRGVTRVAFIRLHRHRPPFPVGKKPPDDTRKFFFVPIMPPQGQRAGMAMIRTRTHVVQHSHPFRQMASCKLALDAVLPGQQPIQSPLQITTHSPNSGTSA